MSAVETIKTFALKFANDWTMNLASMIAYNLITAIFPIILAVLSLATMALQTYAPHQLAALIGALAAIFPAQRQNGVEITPLLHSLIQLTGPLAVVSFVTLLWLGSNLFANIENAFSIIYRIRGRDVIRQKIMAVGMVLILAALLPASLIAAALVTADVTIVRAWLPRGVAAALSVVGPLSSLGVLWLLFLVIYMVVPNIRVKFRYAWRGALTAAVLFGLLQLAFPLYFRVFLTGNARYGAAVASILVVIIWAWFFSLITVIGAQVNAVAMGLRATPFDVARTFELAYAQHLGETVIPQQEDRDAQPNARPSSNGRSRDHAANERSADRSGGEGTPDRATHGRVQTRARGRRGRRA